MGIKKVGIVPTARLFENDNPYLDNYTFVNSYVEKIQTAGGVPVGILSVDGHVSENVLDCCDSFLICGGRKIWPYHFQVVDYAVRTGKPLLGICMGMQVIHSYFIVADEAARRGFTGSLLELYEIMKKERYMFVEPVAHHWDVHMVRGHADDVKHPVTIEAGTRLYELLNAKNIMGASMPASESAQIAGASLPNASAKHIMGASMHSYRITTPSPRLKISARANDGTIEGIENLNPADGRLIGIQFHPEVDEKLAHAFSYLTDF